MLSQDSIILVTYSDIYSPDLLTFPAEYAILIVMNGNR